MLRRPSARALLLLSLWASAAALGQDEEPADGFHRPEKLTAGTGDQFLGQLSPDERTLYFVSSRHTTSELFVEDVEEGRARRLFDEGADVTWPRVSPDGKTLLYVSFRDEASGQLCLRDLPSGGGRRCLATATGVQQAEWIDARRVAVVCRTDTQGNLHVLEVDLDHDLRSRTLLDRGVTNPTISPDGKWVVYLPIERAGENVGTAFAARANRRLEALRLDRPGSPVSFQVDLPGITGQPAFARDGQSLFLVQFLIDSNSDGVVDAADHGILFRVPFPEGRDDAPRVAAAAEPEQLTDSGWNCEYPAPSAHRLVLTCSRRAALDVYELPLDGEIPADWGVDRLREELDLASRRAEQLLLYRHLFRLAVDVSTRRFLMTRLLRLHLDYDDIEAADFYAAKVAELPDPATRGLSEPLRTLVAHRRALRDLELGRSVATFADDCRRRLERLRRPEPRESPAAASMAHLVASEIADSLGNPALSRGELEAVRIDPSTPNSVLEFLYERADALYRQLDDRAALWSVDRQLAEDPAFRPEERLEFARAAVRTLVRGLPQEAAREAIARERQGAEAGSDLAFALELSGMLLEVRDADPHPKHCAELLAFYQAQQRLDRKRAVILDTVERAAEVGADRLAETIAECYLDDVPRASSEHRRAERLFRRAIMGRAFRRLEEGKPGEARADFEKVMRRTDSLEAAFEALNLRIEGGEEPTRILAELDGAKEPLATPVDRFVRAYLLVRSLPGLTVAEKEARSARARALLRSDWEDLRDRRLARDLYGATLEEDYLRTGDPADAERADSHYLVALELSEGHPRFEAMILGQLGVLHTEAGNFRIALDYLDRRDRLPYPDDRAGLATRLTRARVLLHVGKDAQAAAAAEQALARVDAVPALAPFRPLVLDRTALYELAARHFDRATALYDDALRGLGPYATAHNDLVLRLARAAAEIGAGRPAPALADLDAVDARLDDPAFAATLCWPHGKPAQTLATYQAVAAGLRANAAHEQGDLRAVGRALARRRAAFRALLAANDRDQEVSALVLADGRLAENALRRGAAAEAADFVADAVDRSDDLGSRTGAELTPELLDALWLSGELQTLDHVALPFDVRARLRKAYDQLAKRHDPRWRSYERWFEILLALDPG